MKKLTQVFLLLFLIAISDFVVAQTSDCEQMKKQLVDGFVAYSKGQTDKSRLSVLINETKNTVPASCGSVFKEQVAAMSEQDLDKLSSKAEVLPVQKQEPEMGPPLLHRDEY